MVNRILFYIRRKLKHCYSCGTKILDDIWDITNNLIIQESNGGITHIRNYGWGYVCIPCVTEEFKSRLYSKPK